MAGPYGSAFSGGYKRSPMAEALGYAGQAIGQGIERGTGNFVEGVNRAEDQKMQRDKMALEKDRYDQSRVDQVEREYQETVANGGDPVEAGRIRDEQIQKIRPNPKVEPAKPAEPTQAAKPRGIASITTPQDQSEKIALQPDGSFKVTEPAQPTPQPPAEQPKGIASVTRPSDFGQLRAEAKKKEQERLIQVEADKDARERRQTLRTALFTQKGYTPDLLAELPPAAREIVARDPDLEDQRNLEELSGYVDRYNKRQEAIEKARARAVNAAAGERAVVALISGDYQQDTAALKEALGKQVPTLDGALEQLRKNPNDNNAAQMAVKTFIKLYDKGLVTGDEFALAGRDAGLDLDTMIDRWRKNAGGNILTESTAADIMTGAEVLKGVLKNALDTTNSQYNRRLAANGITDPNKIGMVSPADYAPKGDRKAKPQPVTLETW